MMLVVLTPVNTECFCFITSVSFLSFFYRCQFSRVEGHYKLTRTSWAGIKECDVMKEWPTLDRLIWIWFTSGKILSLLGPKLFIIIIFFSTVCFPSKQQRSKYAFKTLPTSWISAEFFRWVWQDVRTLPENHNIVCEFDVCHGIYLPDGLVRY